MAFDPAVETARYIDSLGPEALQKAANYTTGTHWLMLGGLLVTALVTWIIVRSRLLDRLSTRLQNNGWGLRAWAICTSFFFLSALISLPWGIYEEWGFERSYGRTSQPLGDFLAQDAIGILLSSVLGGLFFLGVYALIRRTGKSWWLWSGGLTAFAAAATILLSPVLIEPMFNEYKPVPEGPVRTALLEMADEANIPHDRVLMFDGSRQSNNFTANVSGVFGSARIAISDVAMKQASLDEVKAVTGHEIGHYVLGHVWRIVFLFAGLAMVGFFLADRLFGRVASLFGSQAQVSDPEGLPILLFIVSVLGLLAQPVLNSVTRIGESEADAYSLRTVNLPDALAGALVKTAEYRYPRPSAFEEIAFYSHPSVERRVRRAMDWKADQLKKKPAS
ncbi:M48 family metallopeptidase [Sphingorhabdus contaminans]|uniref:M48 family metallopeptidase n=1 Tax=Sphingorhabdus contaminans TaxID=1343899 RepID=A0A553WKS2_9SPHN|nr:M48 family metallopeptidase [Sphingorhabdus contaminans]TSB05263.1 M48 family metallopeptidase [Sphingorhabdus contaminans]